MKSVLLKEIMVTQVITAKIEDPLSSIEEKMRAHRIRHMPVVDDGKKLIGIITHRDLLRTAPPHKTEDGWLFDKEQMDHFILKHIMTSDPMTLSPDDRVVHAVDIMAREKFGCIPLTDENKKLVGIVTQIDVLKWLAKHLRETET